MIANGIPLEAVYVLKGKDAIVMMSTLMKVESLEVKPASGSAVGGHIEHCPVRGMERNATLSQW